MSRLSRYCLAACLVGLAGCDGTPVDPPTGLPHSLATPSCGPADEPIIAIYLAATPIESLQPPVPFLQVNFPASFSELRPGIEWRVSEGYSAGAAWLYEIADTPVMATSGEVEVTDSSASAITGFVDLRFSDGSRIRGRFEARWQPREMRCG